MDQITTFFAIGWQHIIAWDALDHLSFVLVLTCVYQITDWRKVLILITAFTIGHSITLALSTLHLININSKIIELLIPITILITASSNIFHGWKQKRFPSNYYLALFFGLIHGLGFANVLKNLLGKEQSLFQPLLGFNLGLEAGQIVVVFVIFVFIFLIHQLLPELKKYFALRVSVLVFLLSLFFIFERVKLLFVH
jgi:HupE / UreJ protein